MKNFHSYLLTGSIILSCAVFSMIGYFEKGCPSPSLELLSVEEMPLVYMMNTIHEKTFFEEAQNILAAFSFTETESAITTHRIGSDDASVPLASDASKASVAINTVPFHYKCHPLRQCLLDKCLCLEKIGIDNSYDVINLGIKNKNHISNNLLITKEIFDTYKKEKTKRIRYDFETVDDSYFADAVFLGDSRTVGIQTYSGIDNATFLCGTSLTIFDYNKKKILYDNQKMTMHDALSKAQFKKVYIMFGINECSYGTTEDYLAKYREVVHDIQLLQPDALIFIEANLGITSEKSDSSKTLTNARLFERNAAIKTLANQHDIFYIDINESELCDASGSLIDDYTWDQVHIKAQYYPIWKDFILKHGIKNS